MRTRIIGTAAPLTTAVIVNRAPYVHRGGIGTKQAPAENPSY